MSATRHPRPGEDGQHVTFCRICEAFCGLTATVRDGKVTTMGPDREHPLSQGHICVKGPAIADLTYDPDRLIHPMRRTGEPGQFEPVSWDEALDDIAKRLKHIIAERGPEAVAAYFGNPAAFSVNALMSTPEFLSALGSSKFYGAGSQDSNARLAANYVLFGSPWKISFPDLTQCDFLVILGANPLVSNGSMLHAPRMRHDLDAVAARGSIVVVDPRRTETARRYEHLGIHPGGDIWLLGAMLKIVFDDGFADQDFLARHTTGAAALAQAVAAFDLETAAAQTGIPADKIVKLTRDFASAERAALYGRVGLCRGEHATLANFLLSALTIVTGKFGKPGTTIFGIEVLASPKESGPSGYGDARTRIGDFPSVGGYLAAATLPDDILEEGEGQVRALFVVAGNPVLSMSGAKRFEQALRSLSLFFSIDFYINETNRYADYVLPATTFIERADVPFLTTHFMMRPYFQYTDAVVAPRGEARGEYEIFFELARRMGLRAPTTGRLRKWLGAAGIKVAPIKLVDVALRLGPAGDWFGLRNGISLAKLARARHGISLDLKLPYQDWQKRIVHRDGRIHLWDDVVAREFARVGSGKHEEGLRLFGRRDIRSINSWMHNLAGLVRSQTPHLLIHPDDAAKRGLADGDRAKVCAKDSEIEVRVELTDAVMPGSVCYPHGWGHRAGWQVANATPAANYNALVQTGVDAVEAASGTTIMDGLVVTIERVTVLPGR